MKLHENKNLFRQAIQATSQQMEIPEIYVEKDYWITVALLKIFASATGKFAIFKGGTALSKCHKLIERFSEDIDIVVIRQEDDNANKLKNKLRAITQTVTEIMPEVQMDGITNKLGMIRKTAHQYKKMNMQGIYGQVRDMIIIEATWLGTFEPYVKSSVNSYIFDMMQSNGQTALIKDYNMQPFTVQVLSVKRTFCEKIMSLVRFSFTDQPYIDLAKKVRHIYDLHMMLRKQEIKEFLNSEAFDTMLNMVGADDVTSYKNNNTWLSTHPKEAIIYKAPEETWARIRQSYQTTFKELVIGVLPEETGLVDTLKIIAQKLGLITWDVANENNK